MDNAFTVTPLDLTRIHVCMQCGTVRIMNTRRAACHGYPGVRIHRTARQICPTVDVKPRTLWHVSRIATGSRRDMSESLDSHRVAGPRRPSMPEYDASEALLSRRDRLGLAEVVAE